MMTADRGTDMSGRKEETIVGFIGTGVMGRSMAGHILSAGYPLHVHNRTRSKADALLSAGAVWESSVAELARQCNVIITIVGYPRDVRAVYFGDAGILRNARAGCYAIDMTTSEPGLAVEIWEMARQLGIRALDAPVSGGDIGAREARLSIMVGGDSDAFEDMLPIFQVMGKNIIRQGNAGSGQHTKLANQIAIAGNMVGVCEAMAYAKRAGLDPSTVLKSIGGGAAASWSLQNLAPRMIAGDFAPGFYVKHFIKDMTIARETATKMGLDVPGLALAESLYKRLSASGGGDDGTQGLFRLYEQGPST